MADRNNAQDSPPAITEHAEQRTQNLKQYHSTSNQESCHDAEHSQAASDKRDEELKRSKLRLHFDSHQYGSLAGGFDLGGSIQGLEKILAQYDKDIYTKHEDISEAATPETDNGDELQLEKKYCKCVNTSTLIFKAFYFFYFSAVGSLYPYLAVFYKQLWLTSKETGLLIGIRPLIQLFGAPMWGIIADTYNATKLIFVMSLTAWLVSNYSLSLVPPGAHLYPCQDNGTLTTLATLLKQNGNNTEVIQFLKPILGILKKMPSHDVSKTEIVSNQGLDNRQVKQSKGLIGHKKDDNVTNTGERAPSKISKRIKSTTKNNSSWTTPRKIGKKIKQMIKSLKASKRVFVDNESSGSKNHKSIREILQLVESSQEQQKIREIKKINPVIKKAEKQTHTFPKRSLLNVFQQPYNYDEDKKSSDFSHTNSVSHSFEIHGVAVDNQFTSEIKPTLPSLHQTYNHMDAENKHSQPLHKSLKRRDFAFLNSTTLTTDEIKVLYRADFTEKLFDFLNMEGHYPWPLDTIADYESTQTSNGWSKRREKHLFSILLAITVVGTLIAAPAATLADTATLQSIGANTEEYGKQRLWGAFGWGLGAFVVGSAISTYEEEEECNVPEHVNYMPCFYVFAILMGVAILIGTLFEFNAPSHPPKERNNVFKNVKEVFSCSCMYFSVTVLFCGASLGFMQTFLFWHLQEIGGTQFLFSTITAAQCISEMIMYFLSGKIITYCGHEKVIYIGLACYSARFILYAFIDNPWTVLPFELLHGLSTAAVWSAAVCYIGLTPGASVTMQGVIGGIHWGLGSGGGGVIGGVLISSFGSKGSFIIFGTVGFLDLLIFILVNNWNRCKNLGKSKNDVTYSSLGDNESTDILEMEIPQKSSN